MYSASLSKFGACNTQQRFGCVITSLEQKWGAECRGLVTSLLSNTTQPDFLFWYSAGLSWIQFLQWDLPADIWSSLLCFYCNYDSNERRGGETSDTVYSRVGCPSKSQLYERVWISCKRAGRVKLALVTAPSSCKHICAHRAETLWCSIQILIWIPATVAAVEPLKLWNIQVSP